MLRRTLPLPSFFASSKFRWIMLLIVVITILIVVINITARSSVPSSPETIQMDAELPLEFTVYGFHFELKIFSKGYA